MKYQVFSIKHHHPATVVVGGVCEEGGCMVRREGESAVGVERDVFDGVQGAEVEEGMDD